MGSDDDRGERPAIDDGDTEGFPTAATVTPPLATTLDRRAGRGPSRRRRDWVPESW